MNPEILICKAGVAISDYASHNDSSCVLSVQNGSVTCAPAKNSICKAGSCLFITRWQQRHGLSSKAWSVIGKELLKLYNKEKQCHPHQKP